MVVFSSCRLYSFAIFVVLIVFSLSLAEKITIFEHPGFLGNWQTITTCGNECYNLTQGWKNKVSSVNIQGNCIFAFPFDNCRGRGFRIEPGVSWQIQLSVVGFNDLMASFMLCQQRDVECPALGTWTNSSNYSSWTSPPASGNGTVHLGYPYLVGNTTTGKRYYADITRVAKNWFQARAYCSLLGMRQAMIRTAEELRLLRTATHAYAFNGRYWIGARDARSLRQFVWDNDWSALDVNVLSLDMSTPIYETCLWFDKAANGRIRSDSCDATLIDGDLYALCESI